MAEMGTCKTCKAGVSTEAEKCPHCGEPWPTRNALTKPLPVMGCLVFVLVVLGILVLGSFLGFCG